MSSDKSIDDILKRFGYVKCDKCNNCKFDSSDTDKNNWYKFFNLDIPYRFQDMDPMLLTIISEIMSNIISGNMPTNVANSYGNWLQLISQVILFFNSQQIYYENGPGRMYCREYKNISNPFLQKEASDKNTRRKYKKYVASLECVIAELKNEIDRLKEEVNKIKNE